MNARIFMPAKTAMSSGLAKTQNWVLEYEPSAPREIEPLMGYTTSNDMASQIRLNFQTRQEAVAYAERNGIPYRVVEPHRRKRRAMAYSDNFETDRKQPWTH
ncbi:MAG: ETC complex I subunit [Alphaproteobacteria bacterium]|nr:MAG: ETC complex I subunit [Alphaproteobacteria bacterium]